MSPTIVRRCLPCLALIALAIGIGAYLAATATYRADDFGLVADAWQSGDVEAAVAQWWRFHTEPREPGGWPKFYRPAWHATFLLDAHVFRAEAAASTALSWMLHSANAALVAVLVRRVAGEGWAWTAALLFLLPSAALQAPTWIAARCQVMALNGILAAVAFATTRSMSTAARSTGIVASTVLAAGSHDFGALAGPLAAWAAWQCAPAAAARTAWQVTVVLPIPVAFAWIVWRASRLGCWVGGYANSGSLGATPVAALETVTNGFGSVVLPGDGALPIPLTVSVGAAAIVALAATAARPGAVGGLARLALALATATLLPAIGNEFRGSDLVNGRYLYAAHAAWTIGFVALLAPLAAGRLRLLARATAAGVMIVSAAGFATSVCRLQHANDQARAFFTAVDALPTAEPLALLGVPDAIGAQLLARNALPAALGEPFRKPCRQIVAHATDLEFANSYVLGLACAFDAHPRACARRWDATSSAFVNRAPSDGPLQGIDARLEPPTNDEPWRYIGRAGDVVVLLAGDAACRIELGPAGTLGIASSQRFALGVADAAGRLEFALPAAARNASRLQTLTLRGIAAAVALSNVVVGDNPGR